MTAYRHFDIRNMWANLDKAFSNVDPDKTRVWECGYFTDPGHSGDSWVCLVRLPEETPFETVQWEFKSMVAQMEGTPIPPRPAILQTFGSLRNGEQFIVPAESFRDGYGKHIVYRKAQGNSALRHNAPGAAFDVDPMQSVRLAPSYTERTENERTFACYVEYAPSGYWLKYQTGHSLSEVTEQVVTAFLACLHGNGEKGATRGNLIISIGPAR